MSTIRCFEGTSEQYEEAKSGDALQPRSLYLVDGRPYLALTESVAFAFVDTNLVMQMIAGLSTGGNDLQLGTIAGKAPTATGSVGTSTLAAHEDHTHPAQANITGNAATATTAQSAAKLANARTIRLIGAITGSSQFDGNNDCTITTTLQATIDIPSIWTGTESQLPSQRDANTIYMVYED